MMIILYALIFDYHENVIINLRTKDNALTTFYYNNIIKYVFTYSYMLCSVSCKNKNHVDMDIITVITVSLPTYFSRYLILEVL